MCMEVKIKETGRIVELPAEFFSATNRGYFANETFVDCNDGTFTCDDEKTFDLHSYIFWEIYRADIIIDLLRYNQLDDIANLACKKMDELPFNSFSFENMLSEDKQFDPLDKSEPVVRLKEFIDFYGFINDELDKKRLSLEYCPNKSWTPLGNYVIVKRATETEAVAMLAELAREAELSEVAVAAAEERKAKWAKWAKFANTAWVNATVAARRNAEGKEYQAKQRELEAELAARMAEREELLDIAKRFRVVAKTELATREKWAQLFKLLTQEIKEKQQNHPN